MPQSALPGFPGASHLYHIGATGFFLDHPEHITLTTEQQVALNKIKDQALLAKSAAERNIEKAEQELWTLTAADQPDKKGKLREVGEMEEERADDRLGCRGAVGQAPDRWTPEHPHRSPPPRSAAPAAGRPRPPAPPPDKQKENPPPRQRKGEEEQTKEDSGPQPNSRQS